jgi:hypothetical protein
VVQNDPMSTTISPPSKRVRLTISVSPEVHATFTRLSKASGTSISHQMGEWLADTLEAAEHMTNLVEKARAAPGLLARELHAYSLGLADEMGAVVSQLTLTGLKAKAPGAAAKRAPVGGRGAGAKGAIPPSSNTGGKPTPTTHNKRAGR